MTSHSLCTHAVILTVFNLASTSPRFHHPFCLQARPPPSTSSSGASFSASSSVLAVSCAFFFLFTFPWKTAFPSCSNPLSLQSPFAGRARLHTTQSLRVRIAFSHSSRPPSSRLSHRKTVGPCLLPQKFVVPLPALGKKGGAVTADSPCSCTAESRDCRARSSLHVGDRYPIVSRRSCSSTSARMKSFSSLMLLSLPCRRWLYMLLMTVQLLSSSAHVVNPWYVKTLAVSVSLHIIDCSTTLTYP